MKVEIIKTELGKNLAKAIKNLEGKVGKVGWFEKSEYEDGTKVAYVAAIQEHGWPEKNIPPRPFMRPTIIEKENQWQKIAERASKQVILGKKDIGEVFELIGQKAVGDIKRTISKITQPPLKPATIYNRLHRKSNKKHIGKLTKPLIDTGIMYGTLTNTVEEE